MRAGFIGLGNMGKPMALNLQRSVHLRAIYNRTRKVADGRTDGVS